MNVKLLRKVKKLILEEPRRMNMNTLGTFKGEKYSNVRSKSFPQCGTVGCIAGWAVLASLKEWKKLTPEKRARKMGWASGKKALELTDAEADRLFTEPHIAVTNEEWNEGFWPLDLAKRYERARSAKARATIVAERIDLFIKTKGAE